MVEIKLTTNSPAETEKLGKKIGLLLKGGEFLALSGGLGGGKTCFTRGVVSAVTPENSDLVASPTFAIMNQYSGNISVYHFDFYRMHGEDEIIDLGFEEYLQSGNICIVEWSERLTSLLPNDYLKINFDYADDEQRKVTITAYGANAEVFLKRLAFKLGKS